MRWGSPLNLPLTSGKVVASLGRDTPSTLGLRAVAACDGRVTIPMAGRAESLNAAMAAGIIMWETVRPRQTKA